MIASSESISVVMFPGGELAMMSFTAVSFDVRAATTASPTENCSIASGEESTGAMSPAPTVRDVVRVRAEDRRARFEAGFAVAVLAVDFAVGRFGDLAVVLGGAGVFPFAVMASAKLGNGDEHKYRRLDDPP